MNPDIIKRITDLENKLEELEAKQGISVDMPFDQQDNLEILIQKKIVDIVWYDYYHYSSFWESLSGMSTGGFIASVALNYLFLSANGAGNIAFAKKKASFQNILSYDRDSRIRFSLGLEGELITSGRALYGGEAYAGTGMAITGINNIFEVGFGEQSHYGIYVNGNVMYGICSDGTGYATAILLEDFNSADIYFVEISHFPKDRVDFYVGSTLDTPPSYKASISRFVPTGYRPNLFEFSVQDNGTGTPIAGDQRLECTFVEIIQRKK